MDGVLLLLTAVLLSRVVPSVRDSRLRVAVGLYLALMASYGIANVANDFRITPLSLACTNGSAAP